MNINAKYLPGLTLIFLLSLGCSKEPDGEAIDDTPLTNGTSAQETKQAKSNYTSNGATFKFRLYNRENDNNNNHTAEIHKIIETNNNISVTAHFSVPAVSLQFDGGVVNCQGEYATAQSSGSVGFNFKYLNDNFEVINNQLVSYNYGNSGFNGAYGYQNASFHNHTLNTHNGPYAASSNQGFMFLLNGQFLMFSMGQNSNYGHPMLYKYNSTIATWSGAAVAQIDYIQGVIKNLPTTNHASKAGNSDKIFWAYLSFDDSPENGKINIISYDGTSFSQLTTRSGIGSIGTTLSMEYKHSIQLYKNPDNLNNPYMIVRQYNTDILDIYKFTGTTIEAVAKGVPIPNTIPIVSGTTRSFKDIAFSGKNIYLISGQDKNLYKLSGQAFVIEKHNLTQTGERISAMESTSGGVLISIVKGLNTTPQPKTVSDVVLIPN